MVRHQSGAAAHLKLYDAESQLVKQVGLDLLRLEGEWVIGRRPDKTVRIGPRRLAGTQVLKAEVVPLEQHGFLHSVGVHYPQQGLRRGVVCTDFRREYLKRLSRGIGGPPPAAGAQLSLRAGAGDTLYHVRVRVDDFHNDSFLPEWNQQSRFPMLLLAELRKIVYYKKGQKIKRWKQQCTGVTEFDVPTSRPMYEASRQKPPAVCPIKNWRSRPRLRRTPSWSTTPWCCWACVS